MILELQFFWFKVRRTDIDLVETKEEVGLVVGLSGLWWCFWRRGVSKCCRPPFLL